MKIINRILICFCVIFFSGCGFNKNDVAYLGEHNLLSYFSSVNKVNDLYSFSDFPIRELYKIVDCNGSVNNNSSINDVIKKSKKVFISIGYYNTRNVINNINMDLLNSEIDLFHYYLYEMIIAIKEINKNIYVSSLLIDNEENRSIYTLFNQEINIVCDETKVNFVDINSFDDIKRNIYDLFG